MIRWSGENVQGRRRGQTLFLATRNKAKTRFDPDAFPERFLRSIGSYSYPGPSRDALPTTWRVRSASHPFRDFEDG